MSLRNQCFPNWKTRRTTSHGIGTRRMLAHSTQKDQTVYRAEAKTRERWRSGGLADWMDQLLKADHFVQAKMESRIISTPHLEGVEPAMLTRS